MNRVPDPTEVSLLMEDVNITSLGRPQAASHGIMWEDATGKERLFLQREIDLVGGTPTEVIIYFFGDRMRELVGMIGAHFSEKENELRRGDRTITPYQTWVNMGRRVVMVTPNDIPDGAIQELESQGYDNMDMPIYNDVNDFMRSKSDPGEAV